MPSTGISSSSGCSAATPQVQDGIIGPNQMCYTGAAERPNAYDPAKSKALLAEAGFRDGGPRSTSTRPSAATRPTGRWPKRSRKCCGRSGFQVKLAHARICQLLGRRPPRQNAAVLHGPRHRVRCLRRVGPALRHRRLAARAVFEPEIRRAACRRNTPKPIQQKRCELWRQLNQILVDDVPSHFMWTHTLITGVRDQCRRQDRVVRRDVAAIGKDAMRRPRFARS